MRQNGIVNVSTTINNTPNCCAKWSQTSVTFFHALLHDISSDFRIWTKLSCLAKTRERGMPMSKTLKSGF
jgi:hypothetical protein